MAAPGYQLQGLEGTVTSWGSSSTSDWHYNLIASLTSTTNCKIDIDAPETDTTSIDSSNAYTYRNGLRSWTVSGEGYWQKSSPQLGAVGLVTFASFYSYSGSTPTNIMLHANAWDFSMDWDSINIDEYQANTTKTWSAFRPSHFGKFGGSVKCSVDSANAIGLPHDWTTAATAMKLYLNQNGTIANSEAFSFNALARKVGVSVPIGAGGLMSLDMSYRVSGGVTATSNTTAPGGNIIPCNTGSGPYTNAITYPTYAATLPTADKTLTITLASGRTAAGFAFIKSLRVSHAPGQLVKVAWVAQGSGALAVG